MKIKLIILILFLNMNCVHYNIHDEFNYKLTIPETEKLNSKKIGLLGFETMEFHRRELKPNIDDLSSIKVEVKDENLINIIKFVNQKSTILTNDFDYFKKISTGRRKIYLTDMEIAGNTINYFQPELREIKFDSKNKNDKIQSDDLRNFLIEYFYFYSHLGLDSASQILITDKSGNVFLKNSDAEYWIIGKHSIYDRFDPINGVLTVLSLGLIPSFDSDIEFHSNFLLYDSNLKLIKKYSITKTYTKSYSWFYAWSKHYMKKDYFLFEPTIKELSKLLAEDLK